MVGNGKAVKVVNWKKQALACLKALVWLSLVDTG